MSWRVRALDLVSLSTASPALHAVLGPFAVWWPPHCGVRRPRFAQSHGLMLMVDNRVEVAKTRHLYTQTVSARLRFLPTVCMIGCLQDDGFDSQEPNAPTCGICNFAGAERGFLQDRLPMPSPTEKRARSGRPLRSSNDPSLPGRATVHRPGTAMTHVMWLRPKPHRDAKHAVPNF